MGPSGAGKSTCLNILGCLDRPTAGQYLFQGVDVARLDRRRRALLRRHFIGFVFQGFNLLNRTTALENVELPLVCTREIGIRLAIGAMEGEVLAQFLVEAVILTTTGGIIGVAIGLGASYLAAGALGFPFVLDPLVIVVAFAFSALIGVLFGFLPAKRAAGLDPIEALRHE